MILSPNFNEDLSYAVVNGEKFNGIAEIGPPTDESPFWAIVLKTGKIIWCSGNILICLIPQEPQ